ncbi:hypothetical protein J7J60_02615 [bacterium]|nr:hypothetical protein [bacterium]
MSKVKVIRGYTIHYDPEVAAGMEHIAYVLSREEQDSLFESAWRTGDVEFEDRKGRNFVLKSKSRWEFVLEKRKEGWF